MGFERDYAEKPPSLRESQRELESREKEEQRKKFLKFFGTLILIGGISVSAIYKAFDIATSESPEEIKPKPEETTSEVLSGKPLEVAKPEEIRTARARKKEEIPTGEGRPLEIEEDLEGAEFVNELVQKQYDYYNTETAEFYLTLEKNDPDGEIRNLIAELGEKYGDPENIITYQAIAAVESRYIWERSDNDDDSDDDGVGYFQITNIPESVQRKVRKIAERDGITDEKKLNIIEGILTYKHYRKYVESLNNGDTPEEQKYRAAWEYNAGYIVDQGTIKENINKYKDVHRHYGAKIGAWEIALTEGYRH